MIFAALVEAIEATRQVVIGCRRNLTHERSAEIQRHGQTLLDIAPVEMAVTKQDREDRETAELCQRQLEELLASLLPQIPD